MAGVLVAQILSSHFNAIGYCRCHLNAIDCSGGRGAVEAAGHHERSRRHGGVSALRGGVVPVSYTHLRAHETDSYL
eukprot:1178162-Pleurochrysis_carterae.AAC.1